MAIKKVRIQIDGVWTNLALSNGKWTGTITAPSTTSYNLANRYYPVKVEVTNDAGTVVTKDATDATIGQALRLVVKELIKPVIKLVSPSSGAYVTSNKQPVVFEVTDEAGGSGVSLSAVALKIDNTVYKAGSTGMVSAAITNGYRFTYTPQTAMTDGKHAITLNASDNDGNAAVAVTSTFTVDTVPPSLTISSPVQNLITNKAALTIAGITNDDSSSPITLTIVLNGIDQGTVEVGSDGSFTKAVTLVEGTNSIVVKAKDGAGQTSSITLSVKLDTTVPKISGISLSPNPADASSSVAIIVEVS